MAKDVVTICAKSLAEYPWEIDPSQPHENGELQLGAPAHPCNCQPVEITKIEFYRLEDAAWDRVLYG